MAKVVQTASDFTGRIVKEEDTVQLLVRYPDIEGQRVLEVATSELASIKGLEGFVEITVRNGEERRLVVAREEFDAQFKNGQAPADVLSNAARPRGRPTL